MEYILTIIILIILLLFQQLQYYKKICKKYYNNYKQVLKALQQFDPKLKAYIESKEMI